MSDTLSILDAVILGLVEGLTEFLPVSSTGHLLVAQRLLGLGGTDASDAALDTYAICIQAGAIAAVLVLYVAFVAAVASVRWMVGWLEQRGLGVFGWYRVAIGLAAGAWVAAGTLA